MAPQREWFDTDYYAVLGVASDASDKDVTRAYRKLAKQYHPDANPGNKEAEERFKEVSAANDAFADSYVVAGVTTYPIERSISTMPSSADSSSSRTRIL